MTKETILKRLLVEGHITIDELIILGQKDLYDTRESGSFPPTHISESLLKKWVHAHISFPGTNKVTYSTTTSSKL